MALMFRSVLQNSGGAAELIVACDSEFAGETISCSDGTTTLTKTCPSSSPYTVTFKIPNSGNWTISATVGGTTYTSDAITVSLDYTAELSFGFKWQTWVTAGGLDPTDYTDLADLLTDEKALRRLFLVHDAVDYMASSAAVNADLATVINTDLAAKWINLSDYALDTLYANSAIATAMDTADKYFYGEWVITDSTTTPPTWGPKGNVPVMTANNAPYGSAICSSAAFPAYQAFDGVYNTIWEGNGNDIGWVGYKFTNPVCVKKVLFDEAFRMSDSTYEDFTFDLEASNTGGTSDWTPIVQNLALTKSTGYKFDDTVTNNDYYLYYRVKFNKRVFLYNGVAYCECANLQFYGRALNVSVPVMTSNTTPYGTATGLNTRSGFDAWKAFDGVFSAGDYWESTVTTPNAVGYTFDTPVCVKIVNLKFYDRDGNGKIQASNDGFVNDIHDLTSESSYTRQTDNWIDLSNNTESYSSYRFYSTVQTNISIFQLYGLDYSEKEFEVGTTKKWLYDHGLELEPFEGGGTGITEKRADCLYVEGTASNTNVGFVTSNSIDLTNYNLARLKIGKLFKDNPSSGEKGTLGIRSAKVVSGSWVGGVAYNTGLPNNIGLDISSMDSSYWISLIMISTGYYASFEELWLEP